MGTTRPGIARWARISLWVLILCVCTAGIPKSAAVSPANLKQASASPHSQKPTAHKFKSGRLSEPQKWVSWTPEPTAVRPEPIVLAPSESPSSLYNAEFSSAFPARAPPSRSNLS
jgi:hypothetical protein